MRPNLLKKIAKTNDGSLTWGQVAGTLDYKTGVVDYRNIPQRAYKAPANETEEQVIADRIMDAAAKRLRKRTRNLKRECDE